MATSSIFNINIFCFYSKGEFKHFLSAQCKVLVWVFVASFYKYALMYKTNADKRKFCPWKLFSDLIEAYQRFCTVAYKLLCLLHIQYVTCSILVSSDSTVSQMWRVFKCLGVESQYVQACSLVADWTGSITQWVGVSFFPSFLYLLYFFCLCVCVSLNGHGWPYLAADIQTSKAHWFAPQSVCERENERR